MRRLICALMLALVASMGGAVLTTAPAQADIVHKGPPECMRGPTENTLFRHNHQVSLSTRQWWNYCWPSESPDPYRDAWVKAQVFRITMSSVADCTGRGELDDVHFRVRAWNSAGAHWRTTWHRMECEVGTSYKTLNLRKMKHLHFLGHRVHFAINFVVHRNGMEELKSDRVTLRGWYTRP